MSGEVHVEVRGRTAWVMLDHPPRLNAMTRRMWQQLALIFHDLANDRTLCCAVISGSQDHFCAGGDISEYPAFRFDQASLETFHEKEVWGALNSMLSLDIPLLAEIRGSCMGAGLEIASCCDIRLADVTAKFGAPIARLGFPMAPREAALVHAAVGDATARAMLLAAQVFEAPAMAHRGFLTTVCEVPALADAVFAMVQRIESLSPQAARLNKQVLRNLRGLNVDATDMAAAYTYADTAEHREGVDAFLAKRPARFR